jgi:2Fe-2S ferredoxin
MSAEELPVTVHYIEPGGKRHTVEVAQGTSLMQAAVDNLIPGIDADCGGATTCGTCHCYIEDNWVGRLDPPSEDERLMLEGAIDPKPTSRLSCQIKLTAALDGLCVQLLEAH